jgi:hypothetical protein
VDDMLYVCETMWMMWCMFETLYDNVYLVMDEFAIYMCMIFCVVGETN